MGFFDSLVDTLTDTGKGVVKKAKDVTEVTKIAGQISVEENEIKQAYLAIGKKYYEEVQREVAERFIDEFKRIEESKAKISELKERQKELKGIYECPSCGTGVAVDASFCSSCGTKLEHPVKEETEETEQEAEQTEVKTETKSEVLPTDQSPAGPTEYSNSFMRDYEFLSSSKTETVGSGEASPTYISKPAAESPADSSDDSTGCLVREEHEEGNRF